MRNSGWFRLRSGAVSCQPFQVPRHASVACALAVLSLSGVTGCQSMPNRADAGDGKLRVVAAEDSWGSIVQQIGGEDVDVRGILLNPNADPHDYEPSAQDGRDVAIADYVVVNGIGYDGWASKLLAANPQSGRRVLDVGDLIGAAAERDNPHVWNSPSAVHRVVEAVTADLKALAPNHAGDFDRRRTDFETNALARYDELVDDIRSNYAGTAVGVSEALVVPLADALGLRVLTPEPFLYAVHEGHDPTLQDKQAIDRQIESREIAIYIYDEQNETPDVRQQFDRVTAIGIPTARVTETISPAGASFQEWQTRQLEDIAGALKSSGVRGKTS